MNMGTPDLKVGRQTHEQFWKKTLGNTEVESQDNQLQGLCTFYKYLAH